jgi:putative ABC transport system permease protein
VALVLLTSRALFMVQSYRLANRWTEISALITLMVVGCLVSACGAAVLLRPETWAAPARVLALFGLILGHVSTGIALVIDQLAGGVLQDRRIIEARLALGESRFVALQPVLRGAVHTAMLPVIAGIAGAGVTGLPDLMAGQVLAGADPLEAAFFQIQILLLLGAATGVAVIMVGLGGVLLLTDARHRLRTDRLSVERHA